MKRLLFALTCAWSKLRRRQSPHATRCDTDFPEAPSPGVVYLIGEGHNQWFAAFLCPCRCGELVKLSTLPEGRPRWSVSEHANGTVTLRPSIRRTAGCRSHFFLRRGRVLWT